MDSFEKYYTAAINYLARRPRSSKEIRDNLFKKKAPHEVVNQILAKLREQKFQSDLDFARWWIEQRTRFRVKADRVIKMELRGKGVADDIISAAFSKDSEVLKADKDKARMLLQKHKKRFEKLSGKERDNKIGGFLSRRGFGWDEIREAIDDVFERDYNTD